MLEGGCRCGACRYTLALDALPAAYACHCHQCQRWSGSAFSLNAVVREEQLLVTGPVAIYEKRTDDRISTQRVCADCHSRLFNSNTRRPGLLVVRAGTIDRSEELECRAHIFTGTRQRWCDIPDTVPSWEGPAPQDALFEALKG